MQTTSRIGVIAALLALLASTPVTAQDRDVPAALRPYMTAEEFRAAGLHKLNPAELAQFQAWFVRTMRGAGEDPLARAPEARPTRGPADPRADELALERRRLAEERRMLEEERRALAEVRAGVPAGSPAQPTRPPESAESRFGFAETRDIPDRLDARVAGMFTGWEGPTRITLENGQIWETVGGTRFNTGRPLESPRVTIRRGLLDSYTLQVEGFNTRVQIRRIE